MVSPSKKNKSDFLETLKEITSIKLALIYSENSLSPCRITLEWSSEMKWMHLKHETLWLNRMKVIKLPIPSDIFEFVDMACFAINNNLVMIKTVFSV